MRVLLILGPVLNLPHLLLNGYNFLLAFGTEDKLIHFHESLLECRFVVALLVVGVGLQLVNKVPFDEF